MNTAALGLKTRYAKHHGKLHRPTFAHSRKTYERSGCPRLKRHVMQNIMARYTDPLLHTAERLLNGLAALGLKTRKTSWQDTSWQDTSWQDTPWQDTLWQDTSWQDTWQNIHGKIHGKTSWQDTNMARYMARYIMAKHHGKTSWQDTPTHFCTRPRHLRSLIQTYIQAIPTPTPPFSLKSNVTC